MQDNKLIAEFMGLRHVDDDKYMDNLREMRANGMFFEQGYMTSELRYDTDWNWIMSVVEKIQGVGAVVLMGRFFCDIKYQDPLDSLKNFEIRIASGVNINAVNGAVVNFIKWYSSQQ